jgi:DNA-binding HxlR family transcriptional regulator
MQNEDLNIENLSAPNTTSGTANGTHVESETTTPTEIAKTKGSKRALASINCPVELAIRIIGGKWKPVIIWHLRDNKKRFGELKREIKGITVKMLAQQLRELEYDGLISRKMYYEVPPRVEYSLTDLGRNLDPALKELKDWGIVFRDQLLARTNGKAPTAQPLA